jgi:hypothetical protein
MTSGARSRWLSPVNRAAPIERAFVVLLLIVIGIFHAIVLDRSGALWRDEVNLVNVSTAPFGQVFGLLKFESVPMGCVLLTRAWIDVFGGSILSMHVFAFIGGALIVLAIFYAARCAGVIVPLVALVLCAANPATIYYGDQVRSYGYGNAAILLAIAQTWLLFRDPNRRNFVLAAAANVLAVQFLYQNTMFVGAFCFAGAAIAGWRRNWRMALLMLAAGVPAAISLLPYIPVFAARADEVTLIMRTDVTFATLYEMLGAALVSAGPWTMRIWAFVMLAALICGIAVLLGRDPSRNAHNENDAQPPETSRADRAAFFLFGTIIAMIAFSIFLLRVGVIPKPVYYVTAMAVAGIAADVLLEPFIRLESIRAAWYAGAAAWIGLSLSPLWVQTHYCRTNMDVVAQKLTTDARSGDAIIVLPWHLGVGFAYYYKGSVPFIVVPHITQFTAFACDQMKAQMQEEDPLKFARRSIRAALSSGHIVWIVGDLRVLPEGKDLPDVSPAPDKKFGWDHAAYSQFYSMQLGQFMKSIATKAVRINSPLSPDLRVDPMEAVTLTVVTGYREPPVP